jgi:exosome complex RNA-binding protein Csl4
MTNHSKAKTLKKYSVMMPATLLVGVVGLTSGYVPGVSAGRALASDASMMTEPMHAEHKKKSQAAMDLRVGMNNLLREHVSTSLDVTRGLADQAPQAQIDGAMAAQYANADALAAAVGSVYGGAAQAQFSELFKEHITESNAYAQAVGNGDPVAKEAARVELQEYLTEIAAFFSGAIPGLQAQDVYGMLNEHEELINKSTEAYKAGDFVASYQLEREALKQISMAADALSSGIIATQPDKF